MLLLVFPFCLVSKGYQKAKIHRASGLTLGQAHHQNRSGWNFRTRRSEKAAHTTAVARLVRSDLFKTASGRAPAKPARKQKLASIKWPIEALGAAWKQTNEHFPFLGNPNWRLTRSLLHHVRASPRFLTGNHLEQSCTSKRARQSRSEKLRVRRIPSAANQG